jgi:hypothetical protein
MQYVHVAQGKLKQKHENHVAVEKVAQAFLALVNLTTGDKTKSSHQNAHRYILQELECAPDHRKHYQHIATLFTTGFEKQTKEMWEKRWRNEVKIIVERLANTQLSVEGNNFLIWEDEENCAQSPTDTRRNHDNVFRYPKENSKVAIQMGSIHSIKGQTHTATLVLETFWHDHNLRSLLPWISKKKKGLESQGQERNKTRLKTHYVAMTRPKRLLCLAMRADSLTNEDTQALKKNGWHLVTVQLDGSTRLVE